MKSSDVISLLMNRLPLYTDMFTDSFSITNIDNVAGVATVTTNQPHLLSVGDPVFISGVIAPINITSLTRAATVATLVTSSDHDLTRGIANSIQIVDAADNNFNGTFDVISINNRRTIKFEIADSGPVSTTGAKLLNAERYDQRVVGLRQVATVPTALTFTFNSGSILDFNYTSGYIKTNIRIAGVATIERTIDAYTSQSDGKRYLFVVLGPTNVSKSMHTQTDLTYQVSRGDNYRQQIVQQVSLFVIGNVTSEISGRKMRDEMVDLLPAITKSIAFYRFPTNMYSARSEPLVFVSDNIHSYDTAVYIHEFIFECSTDMDFQDTVGYDTDVAFRDIAMFQQPDVGGTTGMTTNINLDEEEL